MSFLPSFSPVVGLVSVALVLLVYLVYRATFPTPIPGIPCVKASLNRPFGDLGELLKYQTATKEAMSFLIGKCTELNSPIVQVFVKPFGRPTVVLADCDEANDIMIRRTQDFDRSEFFRDLFESSIPQHHVYMKTGDEWRSHRRLVAESMSPDFLQNTAAPRAYAEFSQLIDLWRAKSKLAAGHPIDVEHDISDVMVDTIWSISFGDSVGAVKAQHELCSKLDKLESYPSSKDVPANIPRAPTPEECAALVDISDSSEIPMKAPFGRTVHYLALNFYPPLRAAVKRKNQMIQEKLDVAQKRFTQSDGKKLDVRSASDLFVSREVALAKKENRKSRYDSAIMQDELFGFLIAGSDTSATATMWAVKILTNHQEEQKKLRTHIRNAFPQAAAEGRSPTAAEVVSTTIPYLEASLEELLRCGRTAGVSARVAVRDTAVLGYHIPKGTDVWMSTYGPSYSAPRLPVDDSKRSKTSQEHLGKTWGSIWDSNEYDPERWLVKKDDGKVEFNPKAGPMHIFGAGPRACFGRKLAVQDLRILMVLIIWNFELLPVPEELQEMSAQDVLTHRPQRVFLRLAEVQGG